MYFIEKLIKICFSLKKKEKEQQIIATEFDDNYILEDVVECRHNFIAIDSTGETLACSKCGFLVKKSRIYKNKK